MAHSKWRAPSDGTKYGPEARPAATSKPGTGSANPQPMLDQAAEAMKTFDATTKAAQRTGTGYRGSK
jgi:hypothetical protein